MLTLCNAVGVWAVGAASVLEVVQQMGAEPSGKRSAQCIAAQASSSIQAAGRAIPQLVFDGLDPVEHVSVVGVMACHPMQLSPTLFPPVAYAVKYGITNNHVCIAQRERMMEATITLANAMEDERDYIISKCDPVVKSVLTQNNMVRHIPSQSEFSYVGSVHDWGQYRHL